MSYANPKPTNPATKFIDFKGDKGVFQYYEKPLNEGDEGKNIEVPYPVKFIVIDELSTISGFNDKNQCGVYSNEVFNIKNEILSVRLFKGKEGIIGKYADIKAEIQSLGGKFCKSVYALMIFNGKTELVNLKVKGSFLNAWIESKINTDQQGILIESCEKKKKGNTSYFEPIISGFEITDPDKTLFIAKKYYKILHEFFDKRKQFIDEQQIVEEETKEETLITNDGDINPISIPDGSEDLPF